MFVEFFLELPSEVLGWPLSFLVLGFLGHDRRVIENRFLHTSSLLSCPLSLFFYNLIWRFLSGRFNFIPSTGCSVSASVSLNFRSRRSPSFLWADINNWEVVMIVIVNVDWRDFRELVVLLINLWSLNRDVFGSFQNYLGFFILSLGFRFTFWLTKEILLLWNVVLVILHLLFDILFEFAQV